MDDKELSIDEQKRIIKIIKDEIIDFFYTEKLTTKEQIKGIDNIITGQLLNFPKTKEQDFYVEHLKKHKALLENSFIDIYLKSPKEDKPVAKVKGECVLKENRYKKIFSNDFGFTLFSKWHNLHKEDGSVYLANYSFIFNALQKDSLIVCRNVEFIRFLANDEYCIDIAKIDSRQSGKNNNKYILYNSLKELLEASTI